MQVAYVKYENITKNVPEIYEICNDNSKYIRIKLQLKLQWTTITFFISAIDSW